jgi:hypothetical protein
MREERNERDMPNMHDRVWAGLLIASAAAMTFVTFNYPWL